MRKISRKYDLYQFLAPEKERRAHRPAFYLYIAREGCFLMIAVVF